MLDDRVARLCENLLQADAGMLDPANALLRLQAENFWMEWTPDVRLANHERHEFRPLLHHVLVRIEPEWLPYFYSLGPAGRDAFFDACAARIWFDLPVTFAFAALLGAASYVGTAPSRLHKLNRSRIARGRPALLDHVETRLFLGRAARTSGDSHADGMRAMPRLHSVRGHMVRRRDATFWRMTHLRGDPATNQLARTIQVGHCAGDWGTPESTPRTYGRMRIVFESTLGSEGARYDPVAFWPLG